MDIEEFVQWLQSHDVDAAVGVTCNPFSCPLTEWRKSKGEKYAAVESTRWSDASPANMNWKPLPTWARLFVLAVDAQGEERTVTAVAALKVLGRA